MEDLVPQNLEQEYVASVGKHAQLDEYELMLVIPVCKPPSQPSSIS
jgi:hypothetical protein